ncbi:MAG: histone deacetylase [Deltaproteobacteria bacterium]|nr:histone deacetylase [Deltaproteobacteria bacterium]
MALDAIVHRWRRFWHGLALEVFYDPAYRLPLPGLERAVGFEPRRADLVAWYLVESAAVLPSAFRKPRLASWEELGRVHTAEFLDSISRPEELGRIFSVEPNALPVDEVMRSIRLAVGATIDATKSCLSGELPRLGRRSLNLLGGFHHAGRARAGGFCAVNDIACAIAMARAQGFTGRVGVLDLDAHPPDGTADCLEQDPSHWIGSISGSDWGPLPGVDETVIPNADDAAYLAALDALLARMPTDLQLCFVVAGGDVLAGDPLGKLALTLDGVRQRDLKVSDALLRVPSVWLPAGGYGPKAWRALAGTGLALSVSSRKPIPPRYDPLGQHFATVAASLSRAELGPVPDTKLDLDDVAIDLGLRSARPRLLLDFYSRTGLEHALFRYGVLPQLERLGYQNFRIELPEVAVGESARLFAKDAEGDHLLVETVVEKQLIDHEPILYVHWLTLRHPKARFTDARPKLPGQEMPGLGLAREFTELFTRMALRLKLKGVAYRPASFHTAYAGKDDLRFVDPERQGRFEALIRDLSGVPLIEATQAVADARVMLDGKPYLWEPDVMVRWLEPHWQDAEAVKAAREKTKFVIGPHAHAEAPGPTAVRVGEPREG